MSYALLGSIAFDLLNAPSAFDERRSALFAEHAVLDGKPKLQAMGLGLTEITLQLKLHYQLGNVESRYQALLTAKAQQEALALVLGFSKFKGHFVITEVNSQVLLTNHRGTPLIRDVSVTLREFAGKVEQGMLGAALSFAGQSPLASILPKGFMATASRVAQAVQQGVKVYQQARRTIDEIKNAMVVMRNFAHDPLTALAQLPIMAEMLGGTLSNVAELFSLNPVFESTSEAFSTMRGFMNEILQLAEPLGTAYGLCKTEFAPDAQQEWISGLEATIAEAETKADNLAKSTAEMTAWIALRSEEPETEEVKWTV